MNRQNTRKYFHVLDFRFLAVIEMFTREFFDPHKNARRTQRDTCGSGLAGLRQIDSR